jgi:predicted TIM-barrel fold metal-dependent hydrolase
VTTEAETTSTAQRNAAVANDRGRRGIVQNGRVQRREFLTGSSLALLGLGAQGFEAAGAAAEPIIDIHQHVGYSGRPDDVLLAHQRAMGVSTTILLPAGRPVKAASTHDGVANGLQAQAAGNEACYRFARAHRGEFRFAANEVPDVDGALEVIARYLKRGAAMIAEQKFGVECDAPAMLRVYALAREHRVPVLMHWQHAMYNYGFERFGRILGQFHDVTFIGHAQTWWANIDAKHADQSVLYPKGRVTRGGVTDRYLSDHSNMFGDLSAGSGLNALTRDEEFTRDFLVRHQDKLLFGSDCNDRHGGTEKCQGTQTIATIRRLSADHKVQRKLLYENARRLVRV